MNVIRINKLKESEKIEMINTLNDWEFIEGMRRHVNWETETIRALFELLENLEDDTGEQIEFDPIAFRCEYTEYDNLETINREYGKEFKTVDELEEHTQVIEVNIPQFHEVEQNVTKLLVHEF